MNNIAPEGGGCGPQVAITVDGAHVPARAGDTVASALLAGGRRAWHTSRAGHPRGLYCAIGLCFECSLTVDGVAGVRACQTPVADGMVIETQAAAGGRVG